ncbi:hypothetical protein TREMEDRAFT_57919 [Tremella mesenterica DSM 1558]|uniref:uncharacterized protein n=1 Tax=Tremella mesenterica (strain ATCC 24925 / CBS 8224 / DSM 1558 / NBRC 9311 / NRRL Y-6157 / RJB 2259-6 / UBC 559-6) TaxID=578456 RepID=UPI00032B946F|nr:uncharacterized protein TREMEDRAFT_57919 [Tremella mesenterica DSM 1558]EIW65792.1 hypothetical protein TREMEDRAFT_57919 [Tremella mesenterica DSM 1558]
MFEGKTKTTNDGGQGGMEASGEDDTSGMTDASRLEPPRSYIPSTVIRNPEFPTHPLPTFSARQKSKSCSPDALGRTSRQIQILSE